MSTLKVALVDIALHLRPVDVLICSASFESRSLSIPACVKDVPFKTVLICVNENFPHVLRKTGKRLQGMFPESGSMVLLNTDDPLRTADSLQLALRAELAKGNTRFLVDITTFTHESLLILLRIMKWLEILSIDIAYASAKEYSVGDAEER